MNGEEGKQKKPSNPHAAQEKSFDESKVSALVDVLESGIFLFSDIEKKLHLDWLKQSSGGGKSHFCRFREFARLRPLSGAAAGKAQLQPEQQEAAESGAAAPKPAKGAHAKAPAAGQSGLSPRQGKGKPR